MNTFGAKTKILNNFQTFENPLLGCCIACPPLTINPNLETMQSIADALLPLVEAGLLPDSLLRFGMRRLLGSTLAQPVVLDADFADDLRARRIAEATDKANEQHYEVDARFMELMLGPRLKYSCGLWETDGETLEGSETRMLEATARRAGVDEEGVVNVSLRWSVPFCWRWRQTDTTNPTHVLE